MTTILILTNSECESYSAVVKQAQDTIVSYFGTKHATADNEMPFVKVDNIEVNSADVNNICGAIAVYCDLLVITNSDSPQMKGKFIVLNEE